MEITYETVITKTVDIDFDKLYKYVSENSTGDPYYEFADNVEYYLEHCFGIDDYDESNNSYMTDLLIDIWFDYLYKDRNINGE